MKQKPLDYNQALYRIAIAVNSAVITGEVLNGIVRSTAETLDAKGCSLMLLTPDGKQLIHTAFHGLSDSYVRRGPVKLDPIIAEVLKGKPMSVIDVATDPRVLYRAQAGKEGIASMLSLPVILRDEIIGVLRIYTAETRRFSSDEIEFLGTVASLGAIALEKARPYESREQYCEPLVREKVEQLDRARNELAELEKGKDRLITFISMVAHDLKAPLVAIQSYFGVMLGGYSGELNEKQRQMIERSSMRIDELLELISDLLDICRFEMGQVVSEMKEVSLAQLAGELLDDAQRLAKEKGLTLATDISPDLPPVFGSPIRWQQVFTNLLSNAIKFTPKGGTVTLRLLEGDGEIVGEVQDTGIGIPDEELPRIFDDFYRASNVNVPGTGLGLSIVKRIVEAHGGRIRVESPCHETGVGCKFTFILPTIE
ncbi:MAG: Alkaline phosphatase synthesis sensor protein PhoR [Dehalococcoidia bacterium]|nr:Alkaline phosphatase synthesis sensor protein PhoR [Bacillota bacterium]